MVESWQIYELKPEPPEPGGLEVRAHRILGLKDTTRLEVLWRLRDGRRSHAELENDLDRNPGLIHRALKALEGDGLVLIRVNARQKPVVRSYGLTPSGGLVVDLIERFRVAAKQNPVEVKSETGTYVLYSREVATKSGTRQRVYFFAKKGSRVKDGRPASWLPNQRVVVEHASAPVLE